MRIIADKKDYYDCIQAHGQDQSLVYLRKPEEVILERGEWPFPSLWNSWWYTNYNIAQHIIGFCGKIYPMLELSTHSESDNTRKCFNIDEVDAFVTKCLTSAQKKSYNKSDRWMYGGKRRKEFVQFFGQCQEKQNAFTEYFSEKRCPVFVATSVRGGSSVGQITYNALLRPYDFVRIFDPYTAFQEISMFMGGMAMPEKDMPVISDELKVHSRGFTDQSFRAPFRDPKRVPK